MDDIRPPARRAPREDYTRPPQRGSAPPEPNIPPRESPPPALKVKRRLPKWAIAAPLILFFLAVAFFWHQRAQNSVIPSSIRKSAGFPVYFPANLPVGYKLDTASMHLQSGILFYELDGGRSKINISEQAAPPTPPDFKIIQKSNSSFKSLNVVAGDAIIGTSAGYPVSIMATNTTLVNIKGSQRVPLDVIGKLTQDMNSLPQ